ncbi:type IV pili twitching motility protein PilT [Nitrincola tibetensis]|uniref:Type IV pili twitching motility protein PilT n=1 Tax=Nitrincola tibetensis TaxID=2219697 RepID=A0A364NJB7_9GAMM|nr:PilT/PilU family type 4a pilus ATPase [Nitrincola tibetensis]RAU16985.1 type IV pili twitching motility protein PilT [Nitrincola tibetensis]
MADLHGYLKLMVEKNASDIFFSSYARIQIKINEVMRPVGEKRLSPLTVREAIYSLMTERQIEEFEREWEMNFAYSLTGVGRFRINVFKQRGDISFVIRHIRNQIPSISQLNLPLILEDLVMERRGLVLLVGATGSGKSTSLAAMVQSRNLRTTGHILTIEDPVEYLFTNKKSLISQREVGMDTHSYAHGLKNALREAPDMIVIGEIRDKETMSHAVRYAETGHLCLSTLHANNSSQAIERILSFFPEGDARKLQLELAQNLKAIVSLRLVKGIDGELIPASEVLINSPYIASLINRGDLGKIKEAVEQGGDGSMFTFEDSLFALYEAGKISYDEAVYNADSKNNMALKLKLLGREP